MPKSAAHGFGQEAIGREVSFFERVMAIFGNIPIISPIAHKIVIALGMERDAVDLVPKLSMVLFLAFVGALPMIIRAILHIGMVSSRVMTRGSGVNARFAKFFEVFQGYTIPSPLSQIYFSFFFGLSITIWFDIWFQLSLKGIWLLIPTIVIGSIILFTRDPKKMRAIAQPYPLGKYSGINIYLTGGYRSSILRGKVKEQRQSHMIVMGPSNSGKTTKYFIPGLIEDANNYCSAIVVEAKASAQEDMFALIAPTWAKQGKKILLWDPWDGKGLSFNPLMGLKASFSDPDTRDAIEEIVDAIYRTYETEKGTPSGDAAYYADQEKALMKGFMTLALFQSKGQRNLAAIYKIANGTLDTVVQYIEKTMSSNKISAEVADDIKEAFLWFIDMDNGRADLKASTLRGIAGKMAFFNHPRILKHMVNDEIDLDMVFKEPTLLCIKSPINVTGAPFLASIIIRLLMVKVPNKLAYGAGKDFKVYFYLDELPSLAIPKFDQFSKTARSSGTGIIAAIQDRSDMADIIRAKLGINSIDGLLANFKTQVLLPGLQHGTADHYSKMFGEHEYKERRTVRNTTSPVDFSYVSQRQKRLLLTADSIRYMPAHQSIIVDQNLRPFFSDASPWYQNKKYSGTIEKNKGIEYRLHAKPLDEHVEFENPNKTSSFKLTDAPKPARRGKTDDISALPVGPGAGVPTPAFEASEPSPDVFSGGRADNTVTDMTGVHESEHGGPADIMSST